MKRNFKHKLFIPAIALALGATLWVPAASAQQAGADSDVSTEAVYGSFVRTKTLLSHEGGNIGHTGEGGNIGHTGEIAAYAAQFCFSRIGVLEKAYRNFETLFAENKWADAFAVYLKGLDDATSGTPLPDGDFSILDRALKLGKSILAVTDEVLVNEDGARKRAEIKADIVRRYTDFILNKVVELDSAYLLPFLRDFHGGVCAGCDASKTASHHERRKAVEDRFVVYAHDEIQWVQNFTKFYSSTGVVAQGTPALYLRIMNLVSAAAADDLAESIFEGELCYPMSELVQISTDTAACSVLNPPPSCVGSDLNPETLKFNRDKMNEVWRDVERRILPEVTGNNYRQQTCGRR